MESRLNNTQSFYGNKTNVALFVNDIIQSSLLDSLLTITITPVKYEGCYVTIVIDESLDDIETQT